MYKFCCCQQQRDKGEVVNNGDRAMKKKTKFELRREIKKEKNKFLTAIRLMCYDCQGFLADGYTDCEITRCPLYPFQIKKGYHKNKQFMSLTRRLKKLYQDGEYPKSSFWKEILLEG